MLFLLETAWLVVDSVFGLGLEIWAAQGDQARIDAATLTHIDRVWVLLVAAAASAVIAGLFRAPWTVVVQVLVALLALSMVVAGRHQWDTDHTPSPGCVRYSASC
jgi:hypothetical protein